MSLFRTRSDSRRALDEAEQDLQVAQAKVRKAIDLKDPRFLGEAAIAATRGPAGLALFGAQKGLEVLREQSGGSRRTLRALADDAREQGAEVATVAGKTEKKARKKASAELEANRKRGEKARRRDEKRRVKAERSAGRRFAPLWVTGLLGGAAVAGATAWFLRDRNDTPSRAVNLADQPSPTTPPSTTPPSATVPSSAPASAPTSATPAPPVSPTEKGGAAVASDTSDRRDETRDDARGNEGARDSLAGGLAATASPHAHGDSIEPESLDRNTEEGGVIDSADPDGPADQEMDEVIPTSTATQGVPAGSSPGADTSDDPHDRERHENRDERS